MGFLVPDPIRHAKGYLAKILPDEFD